MSPTTSHSNRQCVRRVEQPREEAAVRSIRRSAGSFQRARTLQPQSPWLLSNLPPRFRGRHFPRGALQYFLWGKVSYRWGKIDYISILYNIVVGIKWQLHSVSRKHPCVHQSRSLLLAVLPASSPTCLWEARRGGGRKPESGQWVTKHTGTSPHRVYTAMLLEKHDGIQIQNTLWRAKPAPFNTSAADVFASLSLSLKYLLLWTHAACFKAPRARRWQEFSASVQPTCFVTCVRFICPQNNFTAFLQLLPVLVLILISVFTQMMATNPPYSLFYKPWVHLLSTTGAVWNFAGLSLDVCC